MLDTYLKELYKTNRLNVEKLELHEQEFLTSLYVSETSAEYLPGNIKDTANKYIIHKIGQWMESRDTDLGEQILEMLSTQVIKAIKPYLAESMADFERQYEYACRQQRKDDNADNNDFIKSR